MSTASRRDRICEPYRLPKWIDGIADTCCIATHGSTVAIADRNGNLYLSADTGRSWSRQAYGLPSASSVLIA